MSLKQYLFLFMITLLGVRASGESDGSSTTTVQQCMKVVSVAKTRKISYPETKKQKYDTVCGWGWGWRRCTVYRLITVIGYRTEYFITYTMKPAVGTSCDAGTSDSASTSTKSLDDICNCNVNETEDNACDRFTHRCLCREGFSGTTCNETVANTTESGIMGDAKFAAPGEIAGLVAVIIGILVAAIIVFVVLWRRRRQIRNKAVCLSCNPEAVEETVYYVPPEEVRQKKRACKQKGDNEENNAVLAQKVVSGRNNTHEQTQGPSDEVEINESDSDKPDNLGDLSTGGYDHLTLKITSEVKPTDVTGGEEYEYHTYDHVTGENRDEANYDRIEAVGLSGSRTGELSVSDGAMYDHLK